MLNETENTMSNTTFTPAFVTSDPILAIIEQRFHECKDFLRKSTSNFSAGTYCTGQFDGWSCFPDTLAGTTAQISCPPFITGFDTSRLAHKACDNNGNWFRHPESNQTWTNYTTCVDEEDFQLRKKVNLIYETGYTISLIAILLSISIFCYLRSLKCARITLHLNLFASFAANNSLWLIWYRVIQDTKVLEGEQTGCVLLHLILHYFLLTNYAWMLCEGLYLHTVLVSAFVSEQKLVRWLIALGWSTPAVFLIIYGCLRGFVSEKHDRIQCWMNESSFTKVLVAPVCLSMLLNLLFLCNIVRVVLLKLKAPAGPGTQGNGPSRNILAAFRATLLLVPLLGLQYILTPFRPGKRHPYEAAYEIISAFTASFQGLCVATLFCFCNGEVIAQIKRKWRNVFFRPRANSYTAHTQVSTFRHSSHRTAGEEKV